MTMREIRKTVFKLSCEKMAAQLGVHHMTYYYWERGRLPNQEYWPLLKAAFQREIWELFPGAFK